MTKEEIKEYIRNHPETLLTRDKSGRGYICPICKSGSGQNGKGTGLTTKDGIHFTCWSKGCFTNADLIEIYQKVNGLPDYPSTLQALAEHFGIADDSPKKENKATSRRSSMEKAAGEKETDYRPFFLQAEKDIEKTTYWQKRGLSLATVKAFHLGYVEQWRHPKAPQNTPPSPRLIIPTSGYSYLARDTREKSVIPETGKQYVKMKVGNVSLFHTTSLLTGKPVFVVEGEIDAMSVYEVGYETVGLGSASNAERFAEYVKTLDTVPPLILAPDNDDAGRKAMDKLESELKKQNILFYRANGIYGTAKDANEALTRNRSLFAQNLEKAKTECLQIACKERETELQAYIAEHSVKGKMQAFIDRSLNAVVDCIPTGFPILDSVLDGGLREGLYVLGAVPSLGKTTFALQVCDQIAAAGYDTLIFSLEMSEYELMAKSLSRYTLLQEKKKPHWSYRNALSIRDITDRNRFTQDTAKKISEAIEAYQKECGERVFMFEGNGDYGVKEIEACIKRHISLTGKKPVVMIDYLQILPPYDVHFSEKQNADKSITELKRITRAYKIPIIVVSSLNRSSYSNKVTLASYKESGAIEYGTDILMGLYLEGVGESNFDEQEEKSKPQRDIVLSILKNRNGVLGNVKFIYFPRVNYFQEVEQVKTERETGND